MIPDWESGRQGYAVSKLLKTCEKLSKKCINQNVLFVSISISIFIRLNFYMWISTQIQKSLNQKVKY